MTFKQWVVALSIVVAVPLACREPTQLTIDIRVFGDLPCTDVLAVSIVARQDRESAERALAEQKYSTELTRVACDGGSIGTLVIIPEGERGAVAVVARIEGNGPCVAPLYQGCIVARRSFAFVKHHSLSLPITLEARCKDQPCDSASSCRAAVCASSEVTCADDGSCASDAEPQTLEDGGSKPPDNVHPVDGGNAGTDGGSTDGGADGGAGDAGSDAGYPTSGLTNLCPSDPIADCALANSTCCDIGGESVACRPLGTCKGAGALQYPCVGALHCAAGEFCCANTGPSNVRSQCTSLGCITDVFLCGTADDCPGHAPCNGTYLPNGPGKPLKICGPAGP